MNSSSAADIAIGVLVLAWVLYRQVQKRPVREDAKPVFLLVLLALGVMQLSTFVRLHPLTDTIVAGLVASLVAGAVFGAIRAYSMKLWVRDGQMWRQGTVITIALWLLSLGAHLGVDALFSGSAEGLGTASIMLYLAVTFGVQRLIVQSRARTIRA